jgi:ribosomal protein S18 acetylase RimI-like enzyme
MNAIRKATVGDAPRIIGLVQAAFKDYNLEMMIYGCQGILKFVENSLMQQAHISDSVMYVAEQNGLIIAVAQFKKVPSTNTLYLNYICTDNNFRGTGLGKKVLRYSILSEQNDYEYIALDVFENNEIAKSWYLNLGFSPNETKFWYVSETQPIKDIKSVISGLPHSIVTQREYGFSQISVETSCGSYSVGLLGSKYYRASDKNIMNDKNAIAALHEFAPGRLLILISSDFDPSSSFLDVKFVQKSVNMSTKTKDLVQRI